MSNSRFLLLLLLAVNTIALLGQVLIDFNTVNMASVSLVYASSLVLLLYLLWTPALQTHPISTFAVFGFGFTTQMGALWAQTAFGLALSLNLRQPLETFATLAGVQLLALLAHLIHRLVLSPAHTAQMGLLGMPRLLLSQLGLYSTPSTRTLWLMGYMGLLSGVIGGGREGVVFKILDGIGFLTWAPFLIPMYLLLQGPSYCNPRRQYPHLVFFMGLVVLIGLAANARGMMLSGFVTIALFGLLLVLRSTAPVQGKRVAQIALLGAALAAVAVPMSDLATAMVVARKARGFISAPQMVSETFRYLGQPETLQAERDKLVSATLTGYDEYYIPNPLVARFVETKFHDNALYFASTLTQTDAEQLAEVSLKMVGVLFPQPVINAMGWKIDKVDYKFTIGDYLSYLSTGAPLGGYKTGSMLAHVVGVLGVAAPLFYFVACLFAFAMLDLLAHKDGSGRLVLSAVAMLAIWKIFQNGVTNEAVHTWLGYFVRTLPQNTVIFLTFAFLARVPSLLRGGNKRRPAPTQPLPG